jgi:hypothetical protein
MGLELAHLLHPFELHFWLKGELSLHMVVPIWHVTPPWELQQPLQLANRLNEYKRVVTVTNIFIRYNNKNKTG